MPATNPQTLLSQATCFGCVGASLPELLALSLWGSISQNSGSSPSEIIPQSGLLFWYRQQTAADFSSVPTWIDSSANANHAISRGATAPIVFTYGGKKTVVFDNAVIDQWYSSTNDAIPAGSSFTIFVAYRMGTLTDSVIVAQGEGTESGYCWIASLGFTPSDPYAITPSGISSSDINQTLDVYRIAAFTFNVSTNAAKLYWDEPSNFVEDSYSPMSIVANKLFIGKDPELTNAMIGSAVVEVAGWSRVLTDSEIEQVFSHFQSLI